MTNLSQTFSLILIFNLCIIAYTLKCLLCLRTLKLVLSGQALFKATEHYFKFDWIIPQFLICLADFEANVSQISIKTPRIFPSDGIMQSYDTCYDGSECCTNCKHIHTHSGAPTLLNPFEFLGPFLIQESLGFFYDQPSSCHAKTWLWGYDLDSKMHIFFLLDHYVIDSLLLLLLLLSHSPVNSFWYIFDFIFPLNDCKLPGPEAAKQPQTMTLPPPCHTVVVFDV